MDNNKELLRQKITDILHEGLDTVSTIDALTELVQLPQPTAEEQAMVFTEQDIMDTLVKLGYSSPDREEFLNSIKK